jgi:hypothetical protein
MKSVSSIVAITALAGAVAGCAQEYSSTYPRYGYSQAAYFPATATYYSYPAPAYYSAPAYYTAPPPSYTKSNVYSSKWDYYRNYQGIHDGPERTGP